MLTVCAWVWCAAYRLPTDLFGDEKKMAPVTSLCAALSDVEYQQELNKVEKQKVKRIEISHWDGSIPDRRYVLQTKCKDERVQLRVALYDGNRKLIDPRSSSLGLSYSVREEVIKLPDGPVMTAPQQDNCQKEHFYFCPPQINEPCHCAIQFVVIENGIEVPFTTAADRISLSVKKPAPGKPDSCELTGKYPIY